ncbi:MAG: hypothetical protein ABRQ38_15575 [Candidatus Eremiobacterota bacterium]
MSDYRLPDTKIEIIFNKKFSTRNYMEFVKNLIINESQVKEFCCNMVSDLKENGIDVDEESSEFCFIHEKLRSSLIFAEKYPRSFRFNILKNNSKN